MGRDPEKIRVRMRGYMKAYRRTQDVPCGQPLPDGGACSHERQRNSRACPSCAARIRSATYSRNESAQYTTPIVPADDAEIARVIGGVRRVVMPNPYCPNAMPGALECQAWELHKHCVCGLPITPDEPESLPDEVRGEFTITRCIHDPMSKADLLAALLRFPATPVAI